jgi:outer membrane receptor protein involved in Fe transport
VSSKGRGGGDPADPWTHLQSRIGLFVQDDFKVTPALTLNLGLRWAYTSPLVEQDNRQSNFDLTNGQQIFATDGSTYDRALYHPYYKGFEPRVGVAWSASDRLVLRAGYGISQFMEGTGANLRLPLNPPFFYESNVNYDRTTGAGSLPLGFADLPAGTTPTGNVRAYDPNLRPQFTNQFNAFVEYRVTSSMSAQAGYVGHRANHLVAPVEGNQALPGVGDPTTWASKTVRRPLYQYQPLITTIAVTESPSKSHYDSVQASVRQREWHGLEFLASYTYAKGYTDNRGYYGSAGVSSEGAYWMNTYDQAAEWGPAFHDIRHNFIFSANWELPWGKGKKWGSEWSGVTNAILGGWKLGGILQARTGFPVTVIDSRARSLQGERGNERPNCIGDWKPANQGVTADSGSAADSRWLNIAGFELVPLGTFGNCPIGVGRAPGYTNVDLALSKRFGMGGPRSLEFRVESFNILNHANFGPPARDISVPSTFGLITSTVGTPRVIELALKFYF